MCACLRVCVCGKRDYEGPVMRAILLESVQEVKHVQEMKLWSFR